MNDIRRTILWVVFGFSMVLLWDQWQVYNGHKATFFPASFQSGASAPPASPAAASTVPTATPAAAA
ncbi:MAG: membrane protein insertase YidC, partial [Burkholderiales bacterium]|nr:membrane protein insertase YidC [Burkholderiales bacterium]